MNGQGGHLAAGKAYAVLVDAAAIEDTAGNAFAGIASVDTLNFNTKADAPPAASVAFISEIHYDNAGTDSGEAIAISGQAGLDLSGWSLVLYNGNPSQLTSYNTKSLSGVIDNEGASGWGELAFTYPSNGIQNGGSGAAGEPDGIALVDNTGVVRQFISYEGAFTAVNGPAVGLTSVNIGTFEPTDAPVGSSVQLVGTIWSYVSGSNSLGTLNTGFVAP